jgi:TolB-like protein/DNA-binding winged helix-turn-helix (wHTH) protein/Flp pilus assembly protein TadD
MSAPLRFGRAEIRPAERLLLVDGQAAAVGARAFDVLVFLIDQRARVVTKDELLKAVWPGVVVEENNLQVQISTLRKLLGAAAITTIPGQGYRFTAAVETDPAPVSRAPRSAAGAVAGDFDAAAAPPTPAREADAAGLSGAPTQAAPAAADMRARRWIRPAVAILATLALGLGAWVVIGHRPPAGVAGTATPDPATRDAPADRSIAVLPFVDLSEKKDQEYFADGLTEELIDRLAHTADLKVIARTSSFQFKGRSEDVRSIGQKLAVANLLEGSVRTAGRTVRVTAQLVRVSDGAHRWSETFERELTDIFKVQDAITAAVVAALQANLGAPPRAGSVDVAAYNELLRGRYFLARRTREDMERAIFSFREAIRLDPKSALAWADLAHAYNARALFGWATAKDGYRDARQAADRALQLDPMLPDAHRALAALEWNYNFDFARSRQENQRAHELDPTDRTVMNADCIGLLAAGNFESGIRVCRRAVEADPLNANRLSDLTQALYAAGRLDESEKTLRDLLELNPGFPGAKCLLGYIAIDRGQPQAGLAVMQEEGDEQVRSQCVVDAMWALGRHQEADRLLEEVKKKYSSFSSYNIAGSYARRGDKDAAFEWLERAYRNREPPVTIVRADPSLRSLHDDPRYKAFLRRMKLPE